MDLLGLKTLNVISGVFEPQKKTKGVSLSTDDIPIDDEETFKNISSVKTLVFFN